MRVCPFHNCGSSIPDSMFACGRHWRALNNAERSEVNAAYSDYLADRIGIEGLRERQQKVLGTRGSVGIGAPAVVHSPLNFVTACRSCATIRDEKGRCWKCCDRLCSRCRQLTGSAFIELCIQCQAAEEAMTKVYGQDAVEVEQPSGDVVPYVIRPVSPDETTAHEWRAWIVVSPEGKEYRVSEFIDGRAACECPAWKFNRHEAGRWCELANGAKVCKHVAAIVAEVIHSEQGASQ